MDWDTQTIAYWATASATTTNAGNAVSNSGLLEIAATGTPTAYGYDEPEPMPVPMILTCPSCGERHIDQGRFATKPHHTHACQGCGMVWRPALVATVGVQFLPGFKDAA